MSHVSSTTVEVGGVTARVVIEDNEPSEKYVKVTLVVEPPNAGMDTQPYSAHILKPAFRHTPAAAREVLNTLHFECTCPRPTTEEQRKAFRHLYPCPYSHRPGELCECVRSADNRAHSPTCVFFID